MYNDADIEMMNATAEANAAAGVRSPNAPKLNELQLASLGRRIGSYYFDVLPDASLFSIVTDHLADEGLTVTDDQFDEIHWRASDHWRALEAEYDQR